MPALTGTGVLVTRPREQAQTLCALLTLEGARVWQCPVLEIRGLGDLSAAGPFDWVVLTSANAVRFGAALLDAHAGARRAAIGPATARALQQAGHTVEAQPAAGGDSEALLTHPQLQAPAGQRVLLIKGRGGRTLLADELTRRGAHVCCREVYERVPVRPAADTFATLARHAACGELHVVTATSVEIGTRLLEVLPPALRVALDAALWIVPTARVAQALQSLGLGAQIRVARSAEDQELVSAIVAARGPSLA